MSVDEGDVNLPNSYEAVLIVSCAYLFLLPIILRLVSWSTVPRLLFTLSTIHAAVMFHLFSTGNTVYSIGAKFESGEMYRVGNHISKLGMDVGVSTGFVFVAAIIASSAGDIPVDTNHVELVSIGLGTAGAFVLGLALLNHKAFHLWFKTVEDELARRGWKVDRRIDAAFAERSDDEFKCPPGWATYGISVLFSAVWILVIHLFRSIFCA